MLQFDEHVLFYGLLRVCVCEAVGENGRAGIEASPELEACNLSSPVTHGQRDGFYDSRRYTYIYIYINLASP